MNMDGNCETSVMARGCVDSMMCGDLFCGK